MTSGPSAKMMIYVHVVVYVILSRKDDRDSEGLPIITYILYTNIYIYIHIRRGVVLLQTRRAY